MAALVLARHRPVLERGDLAVDPALLELQGEAARLVGRDPLGLAGRPQLGMKRGRLLLLRAALAREKRAQLTVLLVVEVLVAELACQGRGSGAVEDGGGEEH